MKRAAAISLIIGVTLYAAGIGFDELVVQRRMKEQRRNWISDREYWLLKTLNTGACIGILGGAVIQSLPKRSTKRSQGFEVIEKK
jgi:hypothetical protein